MPDLEPFGYAALSGLANLMGDKYSGREITGILLTCGYSQFRHDGQTNRASFALEALAHIQNSEGGVRSVIRVIEQICDPRARGNDDVRTEVNKLIEDYGLRVSESGKLLNVLTGQPALAAQSTQPLPSSIAEGIPSGSNQSNVFIVHGHDIGAKDSVKALILQLGHHPIILHEQPNGGRTIIEKFEDYARVDFAVVLLTPDDQGSPAQRPNAFRPRARQNVIFELGYFVGKLGRKQVCALYKGNVEILSDYIGVLYVEMDEQESWKLALAREMRAAGLEIDLTRLIMG